MVSWLRAGEHGSSSLEELLVPGQCPDPQRYRQSLRWFRARQRAGVTIAFGHDPAFWAAVPQSVPWDPLPSR